MFVFLLPSAANFVHKGGGGNVSITEASQEILPRRRPGVGCGSARGVLDYARRLYGGLDQRHHHGRWAVADGGQMVSATEKALISTLET
jgi:hypothetical protein